MTVPPEHLHLGVSLDGAGHHPAAWLEPDAHPERLFDADRLVELVRIAEAGTLDFVTLDDSFALQSARVDQVRGSLDALLSLARVAPVTSSIGLLPTVTTTHTEPFHIAKNVATLDLVSGGRGGWKVAVSSSEAEAGHFGRKRAAAEAELYAEAVDAIDVVRRLWDSWDDDAVIRDRPTGRYIDRERLHYVDFVGDFFSVRGPSITPRSPQAQPLVAIGADSDAGLATAATSADLAFIEAADIESARAVRDEIHDRSRRQGRDAREIFVLAIVDVFFGSAAERSALDAAARGPSPKGPLDFIGTPDHFAELVDEWFRSGAVDGFVIRPARLPRDLEQLVDGVIPRLRARDLFRSAYDGPTLRDHFGLHRPQSRYAHHR